MTIAVFNNDTHAKKLTMILIAAVVLCVVLYGVLVNTAVMYVVERERITNEKIALNTKISEQERIYTRVRSGITPQLAQRLGFEEPVHIVYVGQEPRELALQQ